jgi:hypothetical protein
MTSVQVEEIMSITASHTALPDLEAAVRALLLVTPAFTALTAGPFSPARENQPYPYVTFGEHSETKNYTFGNTGKLVSFALHIWSQDTSFLEAYNILDAITNALECQTLTLTHFTMAQNGMQLESNSNVLEQDGLTKRITARFQIWLFAK